MAPSKKKKPVGNSARGFATTSIPSKLRVNDERTFAENAEKTKVDQKSTPILQDLDPPALASIVSDPGKDLRKLTPEELEDHFEKSNLQLLLEKHGEKSKKIATRQAIKLKTEKRVLRPQSVRLDVSRWLSEETIVLILRMHQSQAKTLINEVDFNVDQKISIKSEDDMINKIWTLELVLGQLGFQKEDFRKAIQSLLFMVKSTRTLESSVGKELVWGLEECIDFLALTSSIDNLPNYEPQSTGIRSKINKEIYQDDQFTGFGRIF